MKSVDANCEFKPDALHTLLLPHRTGMKRREKAARRQELTLVGAVTTLPPLAFVSLTAIA